MHQNKVVFLIIFLTLSKTYAQQKMSFNNPSFEGVAQANVPPPGWQSCTSGSTPDTQPGFWMISTPPSEGNTYLGLVCRQDNTTESVVQKTEKKLIAGNGYKFTVDLAFTLNYALSGVQAPAILRIWGTNSSCEQGQVLWTSPPITNSNWTKYEVFFSPLFSFDYIRFECYYSKPTPHAGQLLIDNLSDILIYDLLPDNLPPVCYGDSLLLSTLHFSSAIYHWQNGSDNSEILVKSEGTYSLEVIVDGVLMKDRIEIKFQECEEKFFIPNFISPNGDNWNENFVVDGIKPGAWSLLVYNRWGERVYQNDSYKNEWQGENLSNGIYYFILSSNERKKVFKSFVEIAR